MKKLIKYLMSFSFVFLLFPVSVIAGELIEAECTMDHDKEKTVLLLLDSDGGKQNVAGSNWTVSFTKNKAVMVLASTGDELILDFEVGQALRNGTKLGVCKFSNLEALEKTNTADADERVEVELKTNEMICGLDTYDDDMVIVPTIISGPFSLDDFDDYGYIGVEVLVDGNGNQARFSGLVGYEKVGNRLELDGDEIETTVTKEQFQEHFGLFPKVTCTAG